MPPVNPTQPKASFLAPVGFGPVSPEDWCDRCRKGDKMCLVKPGRACLNCNKVKMKCSLTDRLRARSQAPSEAATTTTRQHRSPSRVPSEAALTTTRRRQSPSRVPSEIAPDFTPQPAKRQRSSSIHPTPGPLKAKAGQVERSSGKGEYHPVRIGSPQQSY